MSGEEKKKPRAGGSMLCDGRHEEVLSDGSVYKRYWSANITANLGCVEVWLDAGHLGEYDVAKAPISNIDTLIEALLAAKAVLIAEGNEAAVRLIRVPAEAKK